MFLRICKTASKITGLPTRPVSQLSGRAMVRKADAVANDQADVWAPCSRCVQKVPAKIVPVKKTKIFTG